MPSICLHFHIHIPQKLKPYDIFDLGKEHYYFDHSANKQLVKDYANHVLTPANRLMMDLIRRYNDSFKISFSISGISLDLLASYAPEGLSSLLALTQTGCVEWLNTPYYHSLSFLYDRNQFSKELIKHKRALQVHFGAQSSVLSNTHLIYNNFLGYYANINQYKGVLCEGVTPLLGTRSTNYLYSPSDVQGTSLLLRNSQLSEDLSFRFNDNNWDNFPLTAHTYASWLHATQGDIVTISIDYNIFLHKENGIMAFFNHLPEAVLQFPRMSFLTPSEAIDKYRSVGVYDVYQTTSWQWESRDTSSFNQNPMQIDALEKLYQLGNVCANGSNSESLQHHWALLQQSDFFSHMNTIHSEYSSPYMAYSQYMTILADLQLRIQGES